MSRPCRIGASMDFAEQIGDIVDELDDGKRASAEAARFGMLQFMAGMHFAIVHGGDRHAIENAVAEELVVMREQGHAETAARIEAVLIRRGWRT